MKKIYFDYAATAPTDPRVIEAMTPYFFEKFGNASSPHSIGRDAQKVLEESRETLARFIGAKAEEIIFNSGATEANNHVIFSLARRLKDKGNHIVVSAIEHHSVLAPIEHLAKEGFKITYLKVLGDGLVDPQEIKKTITDKTILIAVMHASNEIGTIQPIAEIGKIAKENNILFLTDTVQTVGHIPVNVGELGADFISLSAHKFYGPKGIGALYIRKGTKIDPYLVGGDQEKNQRAGTQNVAGAVGLAKAIELCQSQMNDEMSFQTKLRDRLLIEIPQRIGGVKINGHLTKRLPNNAHFSFEKVDGESLLLALDMNGICSSMGSACTAGAMAPSHVLKAIGLSDELALGSLRITIGRWTTDEQIDYLLTKLPETVKTLRI